MPDPQGDALNRFSLEGVLCEKQVMRYTPAGIPMLEFAVQHVSTQMEAGHPRQVECELALIAAGDLAIGINSCHAGDRLLINGFLDRKRRQSRSLGFHVTGYRVLAPVEERPQPPSAGSQA